MSARLRCSRTATEVLGFVHHAMGHCPSVPRWPHSACRERACRCRRDVPSAHRPNRMVLPWSDVLVI